MYLVSRYGGYGRGIWIPLDQGTVTICEKNYHRKISIRGGVVVSETTRSGDKTTILRYGKGLTVKKNNKVVCQEFYDPKMLRGMVKGGLWQKQWDIPLCGSKGTVESFSTSSGACGREVFTYDTGIIAYDAARWRKTLVIYRPTGKLWMVVQGKPRLGRISIAEQLKHVDRDFNIGRYMSGKNWGLTIYDTDGQTVLTEGHYKNYQKEGKWIQNGRTCYFMYGVKVTRSLYEEDPAQWNPHELLRVPNAQLRCSLLTRFGYDKLFDTVQSRILDKSPDGGLLVEIKSPNPRGTDRDVDTTLRLIKAICPSTQQAYVLRVPPDIGSFEKARQWTLGLQRESLKKGVRFEFVSET